MKTIRPKIKKRVALTLLVVLSLIIFLPLLIPVNELKNTVPAKSLAGSDSQFVNVEGIDVHYKEFGSGDNVYLLLHGFGASVYSWHKVIPELAKKGRVVAFDRPAFGLTDRPLSWGTFNPYEPESQVDLTIGLMDKLGIDKATLIGHSAGAVVAMNTAIEYPYRVKALVLVDPAVYQTSPPRWVGKLLQLDQADRIGLIVTQNAGSQIEPFYKSVWYDSTKITSEDYAAYSKPLKITNWDKALWNLTKYNYSLKPEDKLNLITVPTLVINGDSDSIVRPSEAEALAGNIAGAKFVLIEQSGHIPHEEQPVTFMQAINDYGF